MKENSGSSRRGGQSRLSQGGKKTKGSQKSAHDIGKIDRRELQ
jgi:hypothetical protein